MQLLKTATSIIEHSKIVTSIICSKEIHYLQHPSYAAFKDRNIHPLYHLEEEDEEIYLQYHKTAIPIIFNIKRNLQYPKDSEMHHLRHSKKATSNICSIQRQRLPSLAEPRDSGNRHQNITGRIICII